MAGWIKIHRSMREHWVFSKPDYLRAWITILMEVNHSESKVLINGKLMICGKGESLKSLDKWGSLFGSWSKNKVYRFFNLLKKDNMVELKNETVTTRITVCNYCKYQEKENGIRTEAETVTEQQAELPTEQRRNTNKNVKNVKNIKNENKYSARDARNAVSDLDWIDDKIWGEWIDFKIKRRAAITKTVVDKNIKDLETLGTDKANAVIIQSMDRGWIGLFELKANNIQCPQPKSQTDIYLEKRYEERLKANEQK